VAQNPTKSTLFVTRIKAGNGISVTPESGTGIVTLDVEGGTEDPTSITGGASPFPITGQAPANATAAGGDVDLTGAAGGATSGAGGAAKVTGGAASGGNSAGGQAPVTGGAGRGNAAGGAAPVAGGQGGATGAGGAASLTGGAGGATSGAGGAAPVAGGNATAGNSAGGQASVASGASTGTAAGPTTPITGGQGGTGAGGNGGNVPVTGGAAGAGSNGNGGDVVLAGGAHDGTGVDGVVRTNGVRLVSQGNQATQDTAATLTAAQILNGILTSNPSGAINVQLPLATAMDTALPTSGAGDAFDFSVISIAGSTNLPTITTNTGWTLVGSMIFTSVAGNAGRFRARKTAAGAWTLYRLS
jgi:hypothetical protein